MTRLVLGSSHAARSSSTRARNSSSVSGWRGHPTTAKSSEQQAAAPQVVERRNQLALGQVARGAEDHHGARRRRPGACDPPGLFFPWTRLDRDRRSWCLRNASSNVGRGFSPPVVRYLADLKVRPTRAPSSACSIACRSSGASGATLLGKNASTLPSRPIRYLLKFHFGRSPRAAEPRINRRLAFGRLGDDLREHRKRHLVVQLAERLDLLGGSRLLAAEVVARETQHHEPAWRRARCTAPAAPCTAACSPHLLAVLTTSATLPLYSFRSAGSPESFAALSS